MDLLRIIVELQREKQRLDEAIQALEKLSATKVQHRRGRPSRWEKEETNPAPAPDRQEPEDHREAELKSQ